MNFTNGTTTIAIEANTVKEALEEAIRMNITDCDDYEELYGAVESFNGLPIASIESVFEDLEVSDDDTIEVNAELNSANTICRDSSICHVSLDAPGGFATKDCIVKLGTTLMDLLKENQRFLSVAINEISNLETFVNDTIARAEYALKDGDHVSTSVRAAGTKGYDSYWPESSAYVQVTMEDLSGKPIYVNKVSRGDYVNWIGLLSANGYDPDKCTFKAANTLFNAYEECATVTDLAEYYQRVSSGKYGCEYFRVLVIQASQERAVPVGHKYVNLILESEEGEIRANSGMVRINHLREDLKLFTSDFDEGRYKMVLLVKNNGNLKMFTDVDELYKYIEEHPEESVDNEGSVHVRCGIENNNEENDDDEEEHKCGCGCCGGCCEDSCEDGGYDDAESRECAVGDDTFCVVELPGGFERVEVEVKHQATTLEEVVTSTRILRLTGMNPEQARTLRYLVNEVPVEDLEYKISSDDVITMCARTAGVKG